MVTKLAALVEAVSHAFQRSGIPVPERVSNVRDLRHVMADGVGRTVITTLPILERALASLAPALEDLRSAANLVVIADELSPAEHDQLGASLSQMFPAVALVGFSGTPPERSVRDVPRPFGNIIDSYSMTHAVADEVLVPVWFESRLPDLATGGDRSTEQLFASAFGHEDDAGVTKVRRSHFNRETLAEAEQRISYGGCGYRGAFQGESAAQWVQSLGVSPQPCGGCAVRKVPQRCSGAGLSDGKLPVRRRA